MTTATTATPRRTEFPAGRVGDSPQRPDGNLKVLGVTNPKRIPGATIRYTITVTNAAAAATAAAVVVSDAVPGSTAYVSPSMTLDAVADPDANAGVGDCDFGITTGNTVTCDFASLPASTTRTITYDITVD